ncbi:MAG: choice-of-anchor tandem repeat GloVer-containing protein [Bryobacteraceae bacterium]|jgi:uncharacterized repeat protein (TIGR03803 family)
MRCIHRSLSLTALALALLLPPNIAASETVTLYVFPYTSLLMAPNGSMPDSSLVIGKNGVLYGTTEQGGPYGYGGDTPFDSFGSGTVFSLTPPESQGDAWTEAVLWSFGGTSTDGEGPTGGVVIGPDGTVYGTTVTGGSNGGGTVFSLKPPASPGDAWTGTILYSFGPTSVAWGGPNTLVMDGHGVLYGTTLGGGDYDTCPGEFVNYCGGTVFSLAPPESSGGEWKEALLWSFGGFQGDGIGANDIAIGANGVLYGTTAAGGQYFVQPEGGLQGTVFSLTPPATKGGAWTENVLWSFGGAASFGSYPNGVIVGTGGVLYGMTSGGTAGGIKGTVFSLSPPASPDGAWTEQDLHGFLFNHQNDGIDPYGNLVQGDNGDLYGTTWGGGLGYGTVFALKPPVSAGASWSFAILLDFSVSGPVNPGAGLVQGSNGVLYGATDEGPETEPYGTAGAVFALVP